MRPVPPRVLLIATVAGLAAVGAALLLSRAPVAAPGAGPHASDAAPHVGKVPAADPLPWTEVAWEEIEQPFGAGQPEVTRVDGVVNANGLIVGWGRAATPGRNQFNDMGAVVMSRDGRSWRAVLLEHGVGRADTSEPHGVAFGPLGLLAYGGVCCATEERAVWLSADGGQWTRVPLDGEFDPRRASFNAVVGIADGWIAVGTTDGTEAAIWRSPDGSTWHAIGGELAGLGSGSVADVAVGPSGVVAVGTLDGPDGSHDGGIWTSEDGESWVRVGADDPLLSGPGETELRGVVPFAGGLFVTGNQGRTEDRQQCERLLGMVASTEADPPPRTATSCGWGTEHHWLSADGEHWRRVDPATAEAEHPIEFRVVAAGGPGLVVLGESSGPASPDTTLFASADGVSWSAVGPPQPLGGSLAIGLAVEGRRILAVGDAWNEGGSNVKLLLGTAR